MRSSNNSTAKGNVVANNIDAPVGNGLSHKERLPTIQIDTVPSPPWSPTELSPVPDQEEEEALNEDHINFQFQEEQQQTPDSSSEELRDSLRSFIEELISEAMVVVQKKLQFVGVDDDEDPVEEAVEAADQPGPSTSQQAEADVVEQEDPEVEEEEIRATAEKVVEEVLSQATETVSEQMQRDGAEFQFPITFDEAPEDVKDAASNLIKEIVNKAVAMAEEKAVPASPFNFDVDLIKTSGPWYVRVREALLRVLRSACFCTPRRNDS